jgi:2-dehydro-3-deoxy-D-arabinonate dehydratase
VYDLTATLPSVRAFLRASVGRVNAAIADLDRMAEVAPQLPVATLDHPPTADQPHRLAPVDLQEVWAAGVTYERSRDARREEAVDGGDVYARVYAAERPELFFKARGERVIGQHGAVGIRRDSSWNVPEPELVLVMNPALEIIGITVGNDVSSRDIEGANPLYLPQAKVYTASCALGPRVLLRPIAHESAWPEAAIRLTIVRDGDIAFDGETHTRRIKRTIADLLGYLGRSAVFPDGAALLTGTGVVPPNEFTLAPGDEVAITIDGIGTLTNRVMLV